MTSLYTVLIVVLLELVGASAGAAEVQGTELQAHSAAMMKNAEEMIAHGGMGDARAIVHHCGEVTKEAEVILKLLVPEDPASAVATPHLKEAIRYCAKVAQLGADVDPGVTLNPATKARAAASRAAKEFSTISNSR